MSRRQRRNAKARRGDHVRSTRSDDGFDFPVMVETVQVAHDNSTLTYEEAKWEYLSPLFREAHNRLRLARGLPAIPPPKVDRYVKPIPRRIERSYNMDSPEVKALLRQFDPISMIPGSEGFEIK